MMIISYVIRVTPFLHLCLCLAGLQLSTLQRCLLLRLSQCTMQHSSNRTHCCQLIHLWFSAAASFARLPLLPRRSLPSPHEPGPARRPPQPKPPLVSACGDELRRPQPHLALRPPAPRAPVPLALPPRHGGRRQHAPVASRARARVAQLLLRCTLALLAICYTVRVYIVIYNVQYSYAVYIIIIYLYRNFLAWSRGAPYKRALAGTHPPMLPAGWNAQHDERTGGTYYWHETSGDVQWEIPEPVREHEVVASASTTTVPAPSPATCADAAEPAKRQRLDDSHSDGGRSTAGPSTIGAVPPPCVQEVASWVRVNEVVLSPNCPEPLISFAAAKLLPVALIDAMRGAGFMAPSAIQGAAWSAAMAGCDVIGIASTGSGKTLAYLAPAFARVAADACGLVLPQTTALVLAPTRELAVQIHGECVRFGEPLGVASACVYGGAPREAQLAQVEAGVHIIIATPGRLNDFLETGHVRLDEVSYVVLDEADRMLDMGFEPQVCMEFVATSRAARPCLAKASHSRASSRPTASRGCLSRAAACPTPSLVAHRPPADTALPVAPQIRAVLHIVPSGRQTLLFSATWPEEVRSLAAALLRPSPCHVAIGGGSESLTASRDIEQRIFFLRAEEERPAALVRQMQLCGVAKGGRTLIFCSTKKSCEALSRTLRREHTCAAIHGDRDQAERERALADFRSGSTPLLIATDVAARGLDVTGVELVINYEFPTKTEDYIHRIGRTGRAGAKGVAVTFMTAADAKHAPALVRILKESGLKKAGIPKELRQMAKLMAPGATNGASVVGKIGGGASTCAGASAGGGGGLYD